MGGICGMGMCPLAIFLKADGNDVSGFDDDANSQISDMLKKSGIKLAKNRIPEKGTDRVIITSALARDCESLKKSDVKNFMRRGEALAKICESRKLVAICGSHGKTTTSALAAHAINSLNTDAGYMVGAIPSDFPPVKYCGDGSFFVAEIDESDATIEHFYPYITVALNGDLDHTDTYPDSDALKAMFVRLFNRTRKTVIIPSDDPLLKEAAKGISAKVIEVDLPKNDFLEYDKRMAKTALSEVFSGNLPNDIFNSFKGVQRRQEVLKNNSEIFAIADYAHHPREVKAFLDWLDTFAPNNKLIFFQPHRYTRTKRFGDEFKELFESRAKSGDKVAILPVYAASEIFDPHGTSEKLLSENVGLAKFEEIGNIVSDLKKSKNQKICAAFIGAGDIYFKAKEVLKNEKI